MLSIIEKKLNTNQVFYSDHKKEIPKNGNEVCDSEHMKEIPKDGNKYTPSTFSISTGLIGVLACMQMGYQFFVDFMWLWI